MDIKAMLWLTGATWLMLSPALMAGEPVPPTALDDPAADLDLEPDLEQAGSLPAFLSEELGVPPHPLEPSQDAASVAQPKSLEQPEPSEPSHQAKPPEPSRPVAQPNPTEPLDQAKQPQQDARQSIATKSNQSAPVTSHQTLPAPAAKIAAQLNSDAHPRSTVAARTAEPAPRLYGEPAPEPQVTATDPLEQLSEAEWLQLLSEDEPHSSRISPTDSPTDNSSEHPIAVATSVTDQPAQLSDPVLSLPTSQTSPDAISYAAADLMAAAPTDSPTQTQDQPHFRPVFSQPEQMGQPSNPGFNPGWSFLNQPIITSENIKPNPGVNPINQPTFIEQDLGLSDSMGQVTSVSQLSDVQPTDWAYQALQSLVERYGIIAGYPDGLFRGERSLTRFEFAAGVNAAMDRLSELIANSTENAVSQSDLATLNRLQEDFSTELAGLRGRVDGLEARVAELEGQQFSTTVVLNGQITFGVADAWGGDPPGLGETNPVFAYLAQLQLSGSFSENDAFRIDLDAGNFADAGFANPEALNTQMALMGFQTDTENTLEVSGIEYRFAAGDRLVFTLKPVGFSLSTVLSSNSIFTNSSQGALSRFAAETPIFKIGSLDSGVGLDWLITDRARLQIAYGARDAGDPEQGLFASDHRALGVQLLTRPFRNVTTGIAYVNAFAEDGFLDTFTGSTNADTSGGFLEPAAIHAATGTLQWQIVPSVILGAWGGVTVTDSLSSDAVAVSTTYMFSLGFPDTFGREGDLLGIMFGQPLRLRYGLQIEREDEGSGLHYEIFYRIRVNDNIAIIPGVFVVSDPGHVPDNNMIIVGAIRTAFSF